MTRCTNCRAPVFVSAELEHGATVHLATCSHCAYQVEIPRAHVDLVTRKRARAEDVLRAAIGARVRGLAS